MMISDMMDTEDEQLLMLEVSKKPEVLLFLQFWQSTLFHLSNVKAILDRVKALLFRILSAVVEIPTFECYSEIFDTEWDETLLGFLFLFRTPAVILTLAILFGLLLKALKRPTSPSSVYAMATKAIVPFSHLQPSS